jgi:hypothetical protein
MQKWEYLRLDVRYKAERGSGIESVFSDYVEVLSNINYIAFHNHINKLGSEGWEMMSEREVDDQHNVYYFKRPLE